MGLHFPLFGGFALFSSNNLPFSSRTNTKVEILKEFAGGTEFNLNAILHRGHSKRWKNQVEFYRIATYKTSMKSLIHISRAPLERLLVATVLIFGSTAFSQSLPRPGEIVQLNGVTLQTGSGKWLTATVTFTPRKHPNAETAYNKDFLDDVKLTFYVAFYNKTRENNFRKEGKREGQQGGFTEPDLYDYYHAEVDIVTMKVDGSRKELHFLLSNELAERDGFNRNIKPVGYAVEMTIGGKAIVFQDGVQFESGGRKYTQSKADHARAIQAFMDYCKEKSRDNQGLLVPAHMVSASYLQNAPAVRIQPSKGPQ